MAASAGPIPRTRWSPSIEPNGPAESRSATIRAARLGPMPGSRSSSSAEAWSRSTGPLRPSGAFGRAGRVPGAGGLGARPTAAGGGAAVGAAAARERRAGRRPPEEIAESTAANCWARAARSSAGGAPAGCTARQPRTPSPRAATAATKRRALRSAGVGTAHSCPRAAGLRHRIVAARGIASRGRVVSYIPRITATATSPTTWRVFCETLSSVSSGVWWCAKSRSITSITLRPTSISGTWSSMMA